MTPAKKLTLSKKAAPKKAAAGKKKSVKKKSVKKKRVLHTRVNKDPNKTPNKQRQSNFKFTIKKIIDTVYDSDGLVAIVAQNLKVSRQTVYDWRSKEKKIADAFEDANNQNLDISESRLMQAVRRNEGWAVCFHLKCKGKTRGYVEKMILGGHLGHDITIGIGLPKGDSVEDYN